VRGSVQRGRKMRPDDSGVRAAMGTGRCFLPLLFEPNIQARRASPVLEANNCRRTVNGLVVARGA